MVTSETSPNSPFDIVVVDGVVVQSRYRQASEFERMAYALRELPDAMRGRIASIYCDSQTTHAYRVTLRSGYDRPDFADEVGQHLSSLFVQQAGGHNGIDIGDHRTIGPHWIDD